MSAAPAFTRFVVELADGFAIDTDPARLDLAQVHEWLSGDAYWARGRSAATVARAGFAVVEQPEILMLLGGGRRVSASAQR